MNSRVAALDFIDSIESPVSLFRLKNPPKMFLLSYSRRVELSLTLILNCKHFHFSCLNLFEYERNIPQKAQAQTIIISFLVIVLLSGVLYSYIIPKRSALALEIQSANDLKDRLDKLTNDGPTRDDINTFASLAHLDSSDRSRFTSTIVKPTGITSPYATWILDEIKRYESNDILSEISRREELITSIIPIISPTSLGAGELTLTDYVRLIEVNWLSKHHLQSTSNIGFDGMQIVSATGGIKNVITLPVNLEIRGLSKDVYEFVQFINTAGVLPSISSST